MCLQLEIDKSFEVKCVYPMMWCLTFSCIKFTSRLASAAVDYLISQGWALWWFRMLFPNVNARL